MSPRRLPLWRSLVVVALLSAACSSPSSRFVPGVGGGDVTSDSQPIDAAPGPVDVALDVGHDAGCQPSTPPGEICDGLDNDCDGQTDEGAALCPDDGNPCTDAVCGGDKGCEQQANAASCDDGDACTTVDRCAEGACVGGRADASMRVLFLGNSYTSVNDLPSLLTALAKSLGQTIETGAHIPGGYTLGAPPNQHATDATSLAKIAEGSWDVVVLQEQSQIPTIGAYKVSFMLPGAKQLDQAIKKANTCTRTMLYLTWGRKNGGEQCAGSTCSPDFADFEAMQSALEKAYREVAKAIGAGVAPVGEAWKLSRQDKPALELFSGDGSHPSMRGSYLAACVFFAALTGKSPIGASYTADLPPAEAAFLQQVAAQVVLPSLAYWYLKP